VTDLRTHHYGLTVADLDRAVEFYRDVLGLDVAARFDVSGSGFADAVDVVSAAGSFVHLDAGDVRVELVSYDPEGDPVDADRVNRPGATHLGLAVDDVDARYADLPADVETLSEPRTTESGTRVLFLRDPEGNLVELLELRVVFPPISKEDSSRSRAESTTCATRIDASSASAVATAPR
jgi:catechol 2,3-dioxygenase-like lactoylglutathione lyase family enzyme